MDSRIRVIHQNNAGAAAARNTAIEVARGEFLYFMDGDDWCEPDMLARMHAVAHENELDLLVTGFFIDTYYSAEKFYREARNAPARIFTSQEEFREHAHELFDAQLLYAPWNKLYRRSYLNEKNIRFPETFWDDLPFNLDVVRDIERVGTLDGHFYHFLRARAESENTRYRADMYEKREEEHRWLQELYAAWGIDAPAIQEFLARRYAERLVEGCACESGAGKLHDEGALRAVSSAECNAYPVGKPLHLLREAAFDQSLRPPEGEPLNIIYFTVRTGVVVARITP